MPIPKTLQRVVGISVCGVKRRGAGERKRVVRVVLVTVRMLVLTERKHKSRDGKLGKLASVIKVCIWTN